MSAAGMPIPSSAPSLEPMLESSRKQRAIGKPGSPPQNWKFLELKKCDTSMKVDRKNLARGKRAKVSSECFKRNPTNKGYLTDGDNRKRGHGDKKYWHSCKDRNPRAQVEVGKKCIREVKIWTRADCCSHQMQGVTAEVYSHGKWKRCGGVSNNVGRRKAYTFKCAIVGTHARIIKRTRGNRKAWITTSEMEVFAAK